MITDPEATNCFKPWSNEDESSWELQLSLAFDRQLSFTLIDFYQLSLTLNWFKSWWELVRVCARLTSHKSWRELQNCQLLALCSSRLSKIVRSGPVNKRIQKNLIFTKFCLSDMDNIRSGQLSLRLSGACMRVERTLVQTLASQLSSTLILVWPAL